MDEGRTPKPEPPALKSWEHGWWARWRRTLRLGSFRAATRLASALGDTLDGQPPLVLTVDGGRVEVEVFVDGEVGADEVALARAIEAVYHRVKEATRDGQAITELRRDLSLEPVERQLVRCRELLRTVIRRRGLTQMDVQERLGWGRSYISQLVTAQKSMYLEQVLKILAAIAMPAGEFFGELYGLPGWPADEPEEASGLAEETEGEP